MPSKSEVRRHRYMQSKDLELLDDLSLLWTYAQDESVTLRRPYSEGGYGYTVDGCSHQVSRATLNAWERREWVEYDGRLEGNDHVLEVALTPQGAEALWGDE